MTAPLPKQGIMEMIAYKAGKSKVKPGLTLHKLSSNESGLGPSPKAMEAYAAEAAQLHVYPNPSSAPLREALAEIHDIAAEHLICGAGSDELLQLLGHAYIAPDDTIVQSKHGFAVYHLVAEANGGRAIYADEVDLTANVDNLLAAVAPSTRIMFLANPNNPTGTCLPGDELRRLRAALRDDVLLVIDAAYAEYIEDEAYEDGVQMVRDAIDSGADNVVMTRTFSKMYGLGGLRVGWAYCPPAILDVLNRIRGPFNVSCAAIAAGAAAVRDLDFVAKNRAHNKQERSRMYQRIAGLGYTVVPSTCNFILMQMAGETEQARAVKADELLGFLEERGIFVRGLREYFLPDYVRVSVGATDSNDAFLEALTAFSM